MGQRLFVRVDENQGGLEPQAFLRGRACQPRRDDWGAILAGFVFSGTAESIGVDDVFETLVGQYAEPRAEIRRNDLQSGSGLGLAIPEDICWHASLGRLSIHVSRVGRSWRHPREFVPLRAFQESSAGFRAKASPLLEEEGNVLANTLVADRFNPVFFHRTGSWPAFAADDDPANAGEIQFSRVTKQGFDRQESGGDSRLLKV